MFTLDTDRIKEETARGAHDAAAEAQHDVTESAGELSTGMKYLTASLVTAAAAAVYGLFSHGVYSYYMTYAFMIPLLLGAMPHLIAAMHGVKGRSFISRRAAGAGSVIPKDLQLAVIATLTAGSLLKGALDIYGTTNRLLIAYPVIAALLIAAAAVNTVRANRGAAYKRNAENH